MVNVVFRALVLIYMANQEKQKHFTVMFCDLMAVSSQPTLTVKLSRTDPRPASTYILISTNILKITKLTWDQQLMWSQAQIMVPLPEEERALTGWHEDLVKQDVCSQKCSGLLDTCSGTLKSLCSKWRCLPCLLWSKNLLPLLLKWNSVGLVWEQYLFERLHFKE